MLEAFDWDEKRMNYCIEKLADIAACLNNSEDVTIEDLDFENTVREKLSDFMQNSEIDILVGALKDSLAK
ncbi:MAG TPA: hypothetical protein DF712_03020 [Balneola sp.]|nr:hypothetical protein [Balneola sp.]|tara:strand:+ start:804 stop:1013 length:210 start_codon:yes stop_codon:yes gene_type:complete